MDSTSSFDYEYPYVNWSNLSEHYVGTVNRIMDGKDLDALILFCRDNIRIGSGFRTFDQLEMGGSIAEEYAAIVDRNGEAHILQPWASEPDPVAKKRMNRIKGWTYVPAWVPEGVTTDYWAKKIVEKLDLFKAKKVGFDHLSSVLLEKLKQRSGSRIAFESVFVDFLESRMIKNPEEIKLLVHAADVTDGATMEVLEMMREGVTEYHIMAEFARIMYEAGAEFISHLSIGSEKLGAPTARVMRHGEAIMLDTGFFWKGGYTSDEARTKFVGKPSSSFMEMYNLLKETIFNTAKVMTPGKKSSEIDLMLRKPLVEAGYSESPYATGHGIGLRVMELPQVDKPEFMTKDYELKEDMLIAIEPQTSGNGYYAKLENVVLVKPGGGVSINRSAFLE